MENLTLETLPKAVGIICNEINQIKQMLIKLNSQKSENVDQWFNLDELCHYHPDKPKKGTVYSWVREGKIPVHKSEDGKKLRFRKSEIDKWLTLGAFNTMTEIIREREDFLKKL